MLQKSPTKQIKWFLFYKKAIKTNLVWHFEWKALFSLPTYWNNLNFSFIWFTIDFNAKHVKFSMKTSRKLKLHKAIRKKKKTMHNSAICPYSRALNSGLITPRNLQSNRKLLFIPETANFRPSIPEEMRNMN